MKKLSLLEAMYESQHLRNVIHTTLNPNGPGVIRIHLVPPKRTWNKDVPYLVFLNGSTILPLKVSWAILLSAFIEEINFYEGSEITQENLEKCIRRAILIVQHIYPRVSSNTLKKDLWRMVNAFCDIAYGKEPSEEIGLISINEYAPYMKAPHRMDLMISSMVHNGLWNCNQKCLHCYAADQKKARVHSELSTDNWKKVIDRCRKIGIPQLTFTGGEPTMRKDLTELIEYSKFFVTRLNTNGVLLTEELCNQLYESSLDSIQITLYSSVPEIHNTLVGATNFYKTVQGIKNAVKAGLNVSINTPLCSLNSDYSSTLRFISRLGVKYVSCSGLIPSGNAQKAESITTRLNKFELYKILKQATKICKEKDIEISFTSPGWLEEEKIRNLGLDVPACGACLSNMAIAPNGEVTPCQSWLSSSYSLGNILIDDWNKIWNSTECISIRNRSVDSLNICQLRDYNN